MLLVILNGYFRLTWVKLRRFVLAIVACFHGVQVPVSVAVVGNEDGWHRAWRAKM